MKKIVVIMLFLASMQVLGQWPPSQPATTMNFHSDCSISEVIVPQQIQGYVVTVLSYSTPLTELAPGIYFYILTNQPQGIHINYTNSNGAIMASIGYTSKMYNDYKLKVIDITPVFCDPNKRTIKITGGLPDYTLNYFSKGKYSYVVSPNWSVMDQSQCIIYSSINSSIDDVQWRK